VGASGLWKGISPRGEEKRRAAAQPSPGVRAPAEHPSAVAKAQGAARAARVKAAAGACGAGRRPRRGRSALALGSTEPACPSDRGGALASCHPASRPQGLAARTRALGGSPLRSPTGSPEDPKVQAQSGCQTDRPLRRTGRWSLRAASIAWQSAIDVDFPTIAIDGRAKSSTGLL
jgi:hypothetical protein